MIAKVRQSGTEKPAAPRMEIATGSGVPVENISIPKAPVAADAKAGDEEIPELKTENFSCTWTRGQGEARTDAQQGH